jgi:5-methyltetrahydrofolate--homocysteine methyltransferase
MSLIEMIVTGNVYGIAEAVEDALKTRTPKEVIDDLVEGLRQVGDKFQNGDAFVVDMVCSAETFETAMTVIEPLLSEDSRQSKGKIVLGTVRGDIHTIGKNLVATMMKGMGIDVIDLGIDVTPEAFVDAIRQHQPELVGMSALITSTMREMETTIKAIETVGLRDSVTILVGGAPVSQRFADAIGADIYARNAAEAAEKAINVLNT